MVLDKALIISQWIAEGLGRGISFVAQRLYHWARVQPRQALVVVFVLSAHLAWIFQSYNQTAVTLVCLQASKQKKERIKVKHAELVRPPPPKQVTRNAPKRSQVKKTPPKKEPLPKKPLVETKPKPKPKVEEAPTPAQSAARQKRLQLLEEIEEKMELVQANRSTIPSSISDEAILKDSPSVSSRAFELPSTNSYNDELVQRLQVLLRLPDYGDVRVKLTLKRDGSVLTLQVLEAESSQNRAYVEEALPDLKLVGFGAHFPGENSRSFVLTLTNDV